MADAASLQDQFEAEQADFVALARELTDEQWDAASLCEKWTVRDVVIHAAWHIHRNRGQMPMFLLNTLLAGPTKAAVRTATSEAARHGGQSPDKLVEWLASPGVCNRVNLGELMIHQQDVRRPLGLSRMIPRERLSLILDYCLTRVGSVTVVPGSYKVAKGLRFVALDFDWSAGQGLEVHGPGEAILMAVNQRDSAVADLAGSGVEVLARRLADRERAA